MAKSGAIRFGDPVGTGRLIVAPEGAITRGTTAPGTLDIEAERKIFFGGGGGGSFAQISQEERIRQANLLRKLQAEARAKEEEKKRQEEQRKRNKSIQIEKERKRNLFVANKKYQDDLKTIHTQTERVIRNQELQRQISNIQLDAQAKRLEAGVITGFKFRTGGFVKTNGGRRKEILKVTSANVKDFRSRIPSIANIRKIQSELGSGEKLIFNPNTFEIKGIKSAKLKQTVAWTKTGLEFYFNRIAQIPLTFLESIKKTGVNFKEDTFKKILARKEGIYYDYKTKEIYYPDGSKKKISIKDIPPGTKILFLSDADYHKLTGEKGTVFSLLKKNRVVVRLSNGKYTSIWTKGKSTVSKALAGENMFFQDGRLIGSDKNYVYNFKTGILKNRITGKEYKFDKKEISRLKSDEVNLPIIGVNLKAKDIFFKNAPKGFYQKRGRIALAEIELKGIKKFSPKAYREKMSLDIYNSYVRAGGKKNRKAFEKEYYSNRSKFNKLPKSERDIINKANNTMADRIINKPEEYGTITRINALTTLLAVAGSPIWAGLVGGVFKGGLEAGKSVTNKEIKKGWEPTAKIALKEFGKGALEAYIIGKLFFSGGKVARFLTRGFGKVTVKIGLTGGKKLSSAGILALETGFNIMGAQYISSMGKEGGIIIRNIKFKNYETASTQSARLLGELVGFYGEQAVKKALRKVTLQEDPRLIITKGTKAKPFAIEPRMITVARLNRAQKLLSKGKKLKIKFAKASPVKEPRKIKIVTPEKRTARGTKIDVPTPSGYATYAVGDNIYIIPSTFLKLRPGNTPKTYYKKWFQNVKKKGLIPTFKQLGFPKKRAPTIYKGSGEYLPRKRGESLKKYYARAQKLANKTKTVQVVIAPKTILGSKQPELEIKTIYPNPKGIKASVTRVKVGKDVFGHNIYVEIVAPKSLLQRIKFKISEKIKFKISALKFLTNREAKIAQKLSPRIIENYNFIYVSKKSGSAQARKHMLQVEKNFRKILKEYGIKATDAEIKAVSRLHDILKLRGLNIKDEPIIRKAILEGYLDEIKLIKKLTPKQKVRVANAIGHHQDVNPRTLKALRLDKFTKAFMNADRLDITRYGTKVNLDKLFNLKKKRFIPRRIRNEFKKLLKIKNIKKKFTAKLRKKYNSLLKKYPNLKPTRLEDRLISANKKRYKKFSKKTKRRLKKQEREYTDYKEAVSKYKTSKKRKRGIPYDTKRYKSYKTKSHKVSYRAGYTQGYKSRYKAPTNYRTKYPGKQVAYTQGYKDAYKGNYKINYKTGKYKILRGIPRKPPRKPGIIIPPFKKFKRKQLSKKVPVFLVKVRRRGKIVNLVNKPLILKDAKDYLAFHVDHNLVRSGWFQPIGSARNVASPPKAMKGYFNRIKRKLRPYKIRLGAKRKILNGYIEKKRFIGDTASELRQLQASRRKRSKRKLKRRNIRKGNQNKNGKRRRLVRRKPIKNKIKRRRVIKRNPKRNSKRRRFVRRKAKRIIKKRNPKNKGRRRLSIMQRRKMQRRKQNLIKQNIRLRKFIRNKRIRRVRKRSIRNKVRRRVRKIRRRRNPTIEQRKRKLIQKNVRLRKLIRTKRKRRRLIRRRPIKRKIRRVKRKVVRRRKVRRIKRRKHKRKIIKRKKRK